MTKLLTKVALFGQQKMATLFGVVEKYTRNWFQLSESVPFNPGPGNRERELCPPNAVLWLTAFRLSFVDYNLQTWERKASLRNPIVGACVPDLVFSFHLKSV